MIEVTLTDSLGRVDEAEASDPDSAIFAARTLWDESCAANPYQRWHRSLVLRFSVDGDPVRVLTARP